MYGRYEPLTREQHDARASKLNSVCCATGYEMGDGGDFVVGEGFTEQEDTHDAALKVWGTADISANIEINAV